MRRRILMRNFLDDSIAEHNSRPPLRWIANWAGNRASAAVMRSAWLQEYGKEDGIRHYINETIYVFLWPIYQKYGTFYKIDWDMSKVDWNDYDENGVAYWERTGVVDPDYNFWHFEDSETGDAFRIIENKH
jgi:hypothetical protein